MKTLNLVYPNKSDIKYKIHPFPDGQQNITIINPIDLGYHSWVNISSRLNNWKDLELIVCAVASLREAGVSDINLYVPYIVGARSDRKFEEGGNNYLKDVICPILNSLNLESITCLDPHSDVLEACLKGFRKQSNFELIKYFLTDKSYPTNFILVSPDAGANKKIYDIAKNISYKGEIYTCSKDRIGKTIKVPPIQYNGQDFVIIDDICDGGWTFTEIARNLREQEKAYHEFLKDGKKTSIYLIVTHGVFSKKFSELSQYFDGIYCTNSYSDLDAVSFESNEKGNHKVMVEKLVKQLNVF